MQDHAKAKLADHFSPTLRASYTLGYWQNTSTGRADSYLRDASGVQVYSGPVSIGGRGYTLGASDFAVSNESLQHVMHGLSLKSNTQGVWDWEAAASLYRYDRDQLRTSGVALPAALSGGAGTLQDQDGTGWSTLSLKGIWRPQGVRGEHVVDVGYQQDTYKLRILRTNLAGDWRHDDAGTPANDVGGRTQLRSLYAQDRWDFAPNWRAVLGARLENWTADRGFTRFSAGNAANTAYAARDENFISPKAALSYQWSADTVFKALAGRAVRMPTVAELYGATSTINSRFVNDPNLRAEQSGRWNSAPKRTWAMRCCASPFFVEREGFAVFADDFRYGGQCQYQPRAECRAHPHPWRRAGVRRHECHRQGAGPVGQHHVRRFADPGEQRLRRDAGRHAGQGASRGCRSAGHRAGQLPLSR